jgi:hypothetical protein
MAWSPFSESEFPYPSTSDLDTLISFTVADAGNEIDYDPVTLTGTSDFKIYIRIKGIEYLAYDSNASGFQTGYDGPSSNLTKVIGGSLGGYDAFNFVIDLNPSTLVYNDDVRIGINLTDPGQDEADFVWFIETDIDLGIIVENISPPSGSTNADIDTHLSFTIASSTSAILLDSYTTIYISDGNIWDSNTNTFQIGYDGPNSSFNIVSGGSIDGYDAYNFVIDFTNDFNYNELFNYSISVDDLRTYVAS